MDQSGTIEELFEVCGYKYTDLKENEKVDVSEAGIEILSFNEITNKNEFKQVLSLVRKKDDIYFDLVDKSSKETYINGFLSGEGYNLLLKGTSNHKIYDPIKQEYVKLGDIAWYKDESFHALNSSGEVIEVAAHQYGEEGPVLDLEVEDNACYFSNGILSHNTTTGGNALKFYASQRLDVRRIAGIKDGEELVANRTRVKCVKNKVFKPFQQCEFDIKYGEGIDTVSDLLDIAVEKNIVEKAGVWFAYQGNKIGQGKNNALDFLKSNDEILEQIQNQVKELQ